MTCRFARARIVATTTIAAATTSKVSPDRHYWVSALSSWHIALRCYIRFASGSSDGSASPLGDGSTSPSEPSGTGSTSTSGESSTRPGWPEPQSAPNRKLWQEVPHPRGVHITPLPGFTLNFGGGPAKWTCARNGLDSNSESMRSFQYIAAVLIVVGAILAFTHQQEVIEMVRPIINSIRASF
jgi:hypothetical protein